MAPFAGRGYVHDDAFWALMAERFPDVDLVLQAYKAARWLQGARGKRRQCSEAFLINWLEGAGPRAPRPAPATGRPKPVGTQILEMYGYGTGD